MKNIQYPSLERQNSNLKNKSMIDYISDLDNAKLCPIFTLVSSDHGILAKLT